MEDAGDVFEGGTFGLAFTPDGLLVSAGSYGLYQWDLEDGSFEVLEKGSLESGWGDGTRMVLSPDGRWVLVSRTTEETGGMLTLYDLEDGGSRALTSYGTEVHLCVAFDPTGKFIVTGSHTGVIRVGPVTGGEPHLFLGHEQQLAYGLAVSPDGRWLASSDRGGGIRLWPMPGHEEPPFHTLPHDKLLERLMALTNLRAVPDETSSTGYRLEPGLFPGWANVPTW
jgi:WD40 repeat protein